MPPSPNTRPRSARSPTTTVSATAAATGAMAVVAHSPQCSQDCAGARGDSARASGSQLCPLLGRTGSSPWPVAELRVTRGDTAQLLHLSSLLLSPEMAHLASSGDGLVVTLDKESGEVLWAQNYGSPVVGIYLWHQDSLRRLPHLNLAMETLRYLTFQSQDIHVLKWSYQSVKDFAATKTQLLYVVPERWQPVAFLSPLLGHPSP